MDTLHSNLVRASLVCRYQHRCQNFTPRQEQEGNCLVDVGAYLSQPIGYTANIYSSSLSPLYTRYHCRHLLRPIPSRPDQTRPIPTPQAPIIATRPGIHTTNVAIPSLTLPSSPSVLKVAAIIPGSTFKPSPSPSQTWDLGRRIENLDNQKGNTSVSVSSNVSSNVSVNVSFSVSIPTNAESILEGQVSIETMKYTA